MDVYLNLLRNTFVLIGHEVIVTGEWCRGVMQDHRIDHIFFGRGVQYHLGGDDIIRIGNIVMFFR